VRELYPLSTPLPGTLSLDPAPGRGPHVGTQKSFRKIIKKYI